MRPTLGIVTLSRDQGRFLARAMSSVSVSEPDRLKYVVVDPGSRDGSRQLIVDAGDRLFARLLEPDAGPADGLNKAFSRLDSDVLGFLNADDFYLPGALDRVREAFAAGDFDVLTGALVVVDADGAPRRCLMPSRFSARAYLEGGARVLQQSTFFSRRVWDQGVRFNVANRTCWDGEFLVDLALSGARFATVARPLAAFRVHPGSISGSGRLVAAYREDQARILERIRAAGVRPGRLAPLRVAASRLGLPRRLREHLLLMRIARQDGWRRDA
jgi:glycosyltransferase involved in cell wall biosynthesis